jgi:arsenate reductase-like glutaredoxin family protein
MNKAIIGVGIGAGVVALSAGCVALYAKVKETAMLKEVSKRTGISAKELKASFTDFYKKLKRMKKNNASDEQIAMATAQFYESLDKKSAA